MKQITKACLDFAHELQYETVPQQTREQVKKYVFDLLCCAAAGSFTSEANRVRSLFQGEGTHQGLPALGRKDSLSAQDTGLINGVCGHALEMDDSDRTGLSHPGVMTIMPALIAGAINHSNGKDFIAAITAGYEIMLRVGTALGLAHYDVWHTTSTTGPLGGVVAAGKLYGLDRVDLGHAFGNAGTLACGLWEFNRTYAMSKLLHAGAGVSHALLCVRLAQTGFTGADRILEGEQGMFVGFPSKDLDLSVFDDFWKFWRTDGVSFKPYPCCRHTHGGIDCGLALHKKLQGKSLDSIQSIEIETYNAAFRVVSGKSCETTKQAKFSLPYTVCSGMLHGQIVEASFSDEARKDPALLSLLEKTSIRVAEDIQSIHPHHEQCRVTVTFTDGGREVVFVPDPLGEPENPLGWEALFAKGKDLIGNHLPEERFEELKAHVLSLENLADIGILYQIMHEASL